MTPDETNLPRGQLELRVGHNFYVHSSAKDIDKTYHIIDDLDTLLDGGEVPSKEVFTEWFNKTANIVLPHNPSKKLEGNIEHEVIIDVNRRLVYYTNTEEAKNFLESINVQANLSEHNFQLLPYASTHYLANKK